MVLGTSAYCGSGQDTLADSFCQYLGFVKFSLGDVIREIAMSRNLPIQREILQNIRIEINSKYGKNFVPERIIDCIKKSECSMNRIIITGIRTVEECFILREKLGMMLIFVYADKNIRFQRMLKRNAEKDEKTYSELKIRMDKENELFDYPQLQEQALLKYDFSMTLDKYKKMEEEIVYNIYIQMLQKIK